MSVYSDLTVLSERVTDRVTELFPELTCYPWWTGIEYRFGFELDGHEIGSALGYRAAMSWLDGFAIGRNMGKDGAR